MKNNYFSKIRKLVRRVALVYISANPFMSGLTGDSWILVSTTIVNLLHYICSFWKSVHYSHERIKMKRANNILVLL